MILAPTWQWLLLSEGFGAMTRSLVGPSFGAYIAENSTEETRARVFGITETIFMVVAVIGPPFGGWLVDHYGFKVMLVCAGCLYTLATGLRVSMARTAAQTKEANPQRLSFAVLRANLGTMAGLLLAGGLVTWILLADGVRDVAYALSFNLLPLYLQDIGSMSVQQIGWMESFFGMAMMAVTIPAGWLADKKGERLSIALGFVMQFAALMLFIRVSGFWGYASAWALLGVGVGFMSPAFSSLTSKAVPEKLRGTAFGLFSTSLGVVSLPAPALGAQLWQRISPRFPFALTAWVALLAIVPVWLKLRPKKENK
jgi:DHA1 family tetracycline resistance protein-like MFS transporter